MGIAELLEKMRVERDGIKTALKQRYPGLSDEDMGLAARYYVFCDFATTIEDGLQLTDAQVEALLTSITPCADIYQTYLEADYFGYADDIRNAIIDHANDNLPLDQQSFPDD